jgi:hypothetical protein
MTRLPGLAAVLAFLVSTAAVADDSEVPTFERDVRPLLAKRCKVCHSARTVDNPDVSAGLALDTFEAVMNGVKGKPVVVPGKSSASELIKRLSDPDDDRRMPLSDKPLPDSDRQRLIRWVDAGAPRGTPATAELASTAHAARPRRRLARSLDVVIPVAAKSPAGLAGVPPDGPLQLALKAGPLPPVTALAFRGDGRILAAGTHGAVVLWDLADGSPARVLGDLPGPVHALAFSRDGKRLAIGSGEPARSGLVRVVEVPGGTVLHEFEGHSDVVFGLAFRPDDGQLASASFDQTVRLWNLVIGRSDGVFRGHSDFVYDVAYDRDGRSLLSVSKDRSIKRFDALKLKELRTYSDHNDDILAIALAPQGGRFVTAGHEPQLRWWESNGEKPDKRIGGHGGPVHQLAFSSDGSRLISASGDGSVRLWDGRTGTLQKTLPGSGEWQYAAALSGDGKRAAAGGWDGLVRLWDADTDKILGTFVQPPADSAGSESPCEWLAVSPSGYLNASPGLTGLIRWRVSGKDVAGEALSAAFNNPEALARALRGEPVPPPSKP